MGQVMEWDPDTFKFAPIGGSEGGMFTEREIQKIMRDCIRGLAYCNFKY